MTDFSPVAATRQRHKVSRHECPQVFIDKHGDRYTYERFEWPTNYLSRATVTCVKHGDFLISPASLMGSGECPACLDIARRQRIVDKIANLCGDRFSFEAIPESITKDVTHITLVCKHGPFTFRISNIRPGMTGCSYCVGENRSRRAGVETMKRFIEVHGDRYTYDRFVYDGAHNISLVTCLKHGDFEISAANHYQGAGCPRCFHGAPSGAEVAWIEAICARVGLEAERQIRLKSGVKRGRMSADAVFGQVAINYDGGYWHSRPGSMDKDVRNTQTFLDAGYVMVRLRSNDRKEITLNPVLNAINFTVTADPTTPESLIVLDHIAEIIRKENHHD